MPDFGIAVKYTYVNSQHLIAEQLYQYDISAPSGYPNIWGAIITEYASNACPRFGVSILDDGGAIGVRASKEFTGIIKIISFWGKHPNYLTS